MKVYVDSRHRISGTNEDFVWQIPETVDIPDSWCYIDCVLIPNTFYSVRHGHNDKLYIKERNGSTDTFRVVQIPPGQYNGITLATAVQTVMNAGSAFFYAVTYDQSTAKLKISSATSGTNYFTIYGEPSLTSNHWNTQAPSNLHVDASNTQSANKVCGFLKLNENTGTTNNAVTLVADSVIDVQRHHAIFIHSDLGEPGSSWGCRGESSVIRRVVVDALQNGLATQSIDIQPLGML